MKQKKKLISPLFDKAFMYGLASLVPLAIDWGLLNLLYLKVGLSYLFAGAIGFSIGCVVNYLISRKYVFIDGSGNHQSKTFVLFAIVGVLGLALNHIILYTGVDMLHMPVNVAKAFSVGIVFWFNFLIRGFYVFKDPELCKQK